MQRQLRTFRCVKSRQSERQIVRKGRTPTSQTYANLLSW